MFGAVSLFWKFVKSGKCFCRLWLGELHIGPKRVREQESIDPVRIIVMLMLFYRERAPRRRRPPRRAPQGPEDGRARANEAVGGDGLDAAVVRDGTGAAAGSTPHRDFDPGRGRRHQPRGARGRWDDASDLVSSAWAQVW